MTLKHCINVIPGVLYKHLNVIWERLTCLNTIRHWARIPDGDAAPGLHWIFILERHYKL